MDNNTNFISRRSFVQKSSAASAVAAFEIVKPELVRGAGQEMLKAGLIGCGGRGTQAVVDMMTGTENVQLVSMGDIFEDKLEGSLGKIRGNPNFGKFQDRIKVDAEHRFVGFDAFKKVLASDIDIVMLATPPGYRPMHFEAAVDAKKHVFCEKPFGTDPVNVRRFMTAAKKSEDLKLTVMSGAQRRNQKEYLTALDEVRSGKIGDISALYAYWEGTPVFPVKERDPKWGDMTWQHRMWYSYVWICGDQIVEQHLHNIDVCNWFMGAHPVRVVASGGAIWRPREEFYGNIYDHVSADFEYPNGVHLSSYCRQFPKNQNPSIASRIGERLVGTKGVMHFANQPTKAINPYVNEHTQMVRSIRGDGPYVNHGMAVAESTMTCIMGREAAYSGQELTWEQMMSSQLDLMPKTFDYDAKMEIPPLPTPGSYKFV